MVNVIADEAAEIAVADGLEEGGYFFGVSGGEQFYAAIGEIANPAGDVEAGGDLADTPAEAYALDTAFGEDMTGGHGRIFEFRISNFELESAEDATSGFRILPEGFKFKCKFRFKGGYTWILCR